MDKLISQLVENGVYLSKTGEKLSIEFNSDSIPDDLLQEIKKNKNALLDYLSREDAKTDYKDIIPVNGPGPFKLSSAQRRLWVLSQFEGGSAAYNISGSTYLNQDIDIENFERSIDATIDRHEILRTVFREDASGEVRQWVLERQDLGFAIDYRDFRSEADKQQKAQAYIAADAHRAFDLEQGPLLRAALLQVEESEYVFYFNMHHIISDGWSMEILSKDVFAYYEAYQAGKQPQVKQLRIQYKDYSAWQLGQLNQESFKTHQAYWLDKLAGELPLLDLPATKQRPKVKSYNGQGLATYLDKTTTAKLKGYIQDKGGSLFMGLLASWNVLMYRYTAQQDIIIGTAVAGRGHADLEEQIGFYVNTLALRNKVDPQDSFDDFYQALKEDTLKSYGHQMYPFDRLVEDLNLHRDTSRSPVFDVMLILQNNGEKSKGVELAEWELNQVVDLSYSTAKFDLEITFQEAGDCLSLQMIFNTDVYEKAMVEGMIRHYKHLLNALLETPQAKLSQVDYLSEEEKHQLLVTFNDTAVAYPKDKTIVDLFEEQAAKTPDNIAVVFEDTQLTYQQLDEKSNQLAHYLRENYQIQPDDLVGIQLERSEWVIIAILGVLKAGGAYLPIDADYPSSRKAYIVKDSALKLLITETSFIYDIDYYQGAVFAIDKEFDAQRYPARGLSTTSTPAHLAYVMYTSGSTGVPKGVMVEHRSIVRLVYKTNFFSPAASDKLVLTGALSFDATTFELWSMLVSGAQVHVLSQDKLLDVASFKQTLHEQAITVLWLTAPWFNQLVDTDLSFFSSLRYLVSGGDKMSAVHVNKVKQAYPALELVNGYGPTENTTFSACYRVEAKAYQDRIPIGKPVSNSKVYVLDEAMELVAVGVVGQIYAGGDGLARGYLNQEGLTQEKFIASPFKAGERLYKTGDLGRWLPDGNLEFVGRKDDQVKISGHRIELAEIEQALLNHQQINQAVVLAKANQSAEKELVAYITAKVEQSTGELRAYLAETLPVYMLPAYFVQLEAMPLTANGKIDKESLPDPQGVGLSGGVAYVAPRNKLEAKLVEIWQQVLQRENIGVNDDFFVLGGHSLKAIRLSNEYQKELAVKLTLKDLFAHTSLAAHAELIESAIRETFVEIEKAAPQASYPISDAQRRLWVLSQFEGGSAAYNLPGSTYLNQDIDIENFKRAIDATIDRHEILRTVFREDASGEIRQWMLERQDLSFAIDYRDFRNEVDKHQKAQAYIAADAHRAFDLEQGPLLRAALLQVEEAQYVFYFNMHHIISDGWSMEVLSKDVFAYYEAYQAGRQPQIKALRIQYKDYSAWQLGQLNQESFKAHQAYWLDKLAGELPLLDLPASKQRPKVKSYNGQGLATYLDKATTAKLKGYIQDKGGSLFMGLLASWNVLMYRYTAQQDIIIGTAVAGREHADLEEQIGFYVNMLALRNQVDPQESFDGFYQALKEDTLKSYGHQMYPFDRLVEDLNLHRDTSRSAVFDVSLTLQNNGEKSKGVELSDQELNRIVDLSYSTAKFDLEIIAQEEGECLSLQMIFNTDVYEKAMVEGLIRHYKHLLNALLETPQAKISQVDYLSEEEKHQLLVTFNDTAVAYPKDKTIVDLFEEQAAKTPDQVAVVFEYIELTYQQLDERSNQLAHYLRENYQIRPDDLVGIQLERSEWMLVSILGVLKAGGAYVPIDPHSPPQRVAAILEDSGCKVLLDAPALAGLQQAEKAYAAGPITSQAKAHNLAYVIYTSGSTGKPKGVMIEHGNVTNFFTGMTAVFGEQQGTFLSMTNFTFDISVLELLWTLTKGYKVVIQPEARHLGEQHDQLAGGEQHDQPGGQQAHARPAGNYSVYAQIRTHQVTHLQITPSMGALLNEHLSKDAGWASIRHILLGGEPVRAWLVKELYQKLPHAQVYNMYGPTETTVWSTVKALEKDQERISIGKPIANTRIYVLDQNGNPVASGVEGELYIGGAGVARGYTRRELTEGSFRQSPFVAGDRLYRTGDYGSWLQDGSLYCAGRKDQQVKIRGHRIELAEIEQALEQHQHIEQAVVLARENQSGEKELVAYITASSAQNTSELRAYLAETLPAYMLPAHFVQLEAMPLTTSGKVDKKSLPDPQGVGLSGGVAYVAPRNKLEAKLAEIWQEVLQRENIGVNDDFFALGGHSLKAVRLSNEYQKELAVKLTLKDLFAHTSLAAHAALIESATREAFVQIEKAAPQASYPISDAQRRLWVLSQFEGGSAAYNMPGSTYLNQDIDIENFKRAIDATIDRHEILRTVFREDASGEIRQWVLEKEDLGFAIDYRDFRSEVDKHQKAQAYIAADAHRAFDLEQGPLLRAALLQVEEAQYVFYFNMHHIISDGWSMEVLSKDVFTFYEAYQAGKQPQVKQLRIQYKDYSAWQLGQLNQESFKTHQAYWFDKLAGELPLLDLPATKQRPNVKTYNGQGLATYLDKTTTAKLKGYIQDKGGSLFMGLLASWNVLMYRYTAQQDIIIGSPIAGREHADLEDQIGFYVNTLALRNQVDPQESFDGFYQALKEDTLKSYGHQMYPFDRLVEDLNLHRDTSRSAVFDVMLILQNNGEKSKGVELAEEALNQTVDQGYRTSRFDLEITAEEMGDYLSLSLVFNPDVYEKAMVEGMIRHYKHLLNALLETPQAKLSQVDYLSEEEKHTLLVTYNDTAVAYPKDKTIVDLFEEQVARTPDNVAVVFEDIELTYQQLDERSNQLAHYLRDNYDIRPDDLVAIQLERSEWMIIAILGVLKAGGAYVPIDVHSPPQRVAAILEDSGCKVLLDAPALAGLRQAEQAYAAGPITSQAKAHHLAYVIYTSGSTGKPKGVMIEHGNVTNFFTGMTAIFGEQQGTLLSMTNFTFDISVLELLWTLTKGYKVVIQPEARHIGEQDDQLEGSEQAHARPAGNYSVYAQIRTHQVTHLQITPSMGALLNEHLSKDAGWASIRHILLGGEPVRAWLVKELYQKLPHAQVYNMYGPTETTVWSTVKALQKDQERILIGKPIANTRIYVLDQNGNPVASGVEGELYIGGAGVARGYTRRELTEGSFRQSPFVAGDRLYRTGDYGSWLQDGSLYCAGRKDDQVKIRGHRIELAEIEQALEQHQRIEQAVVVVKANESGEKELVAYITANSEQNTNDLRAYLAETLPAYMLPAYFVQLEAMPLTTSGKVDKKSLPDPQGVGLSGGVAYVAPGTAQERVLVSVWSDVLKREGIGIKDNFYNLGGDSIKSIQVVARLKQHGYRLKVEHLLRTPVVEELARLMERTTQVSDQSEVSGEVVLTPIQDWFFKAEQIKVPDHYNQSVVLYSKEQLDGQILEQSLADLTRHHDALRMVYQQSPSGAWQQFNQDTSAKRYTLDFYDLRQSEDALGQMMQLGEAQQASIKLSAGPLLRVLHFRLQDGDRLGLIIHHLVVDGVSWRILLEDLSSLYTSYKEGKKPSLPSKTDSFQRWAFLQQEYAASPALDKERTYWQKVSEQPMAALPQDKALPEGRQAVLDSAESFGLDQNTTELLQTRVHRVYNTEINDVLLTGLALALREVLTVDKSVLKMEGHGREEILDGVDISRTVGWFTTVYPFVLQVADAASRAESLVGVKESLRSIPNKGIGYGILSHLSRQGLDSKLTPEITFNYLGDFGSNVSNEGDSLFEYASERIGSNISRDNTTDAILDVLGMLVKGELGMSIRYSSARYEVATIRKIAAAYKKNLELLIETLAKADTTYLTPSDLSFKGLSQEELSVINSDNDLEDVYELAPLQEGIYYHWLTQDSNSLYFEQTSYKVRTKGLAIEKLKGAYDRLTARHAVLRTSFTTEYAGRSLQIVRKEVASNFTYQKLDKQADQQAQVALIKQQDRERGFDLSSGSQMRLHVVELSEGEYEFIWSHHHILMDGWCVSVLINDFNELLSAALKGTTPHLSPVVPYADYINWLRAIDSDSSLSYWKDYLSGYASVAEIPFKAQTADTTYVESSKRLQIGGSLFKKVDALCTQLGITHNTFVQAVWGYLLSRYNNTSDVVFGAVVSGRPADLPGVEDMIGLFSNTIPVRVKYAPDDTPATLLKEMQEQSIRSTSHHYVNLSEVQAQSELGVELMNHIMIFENYAVKELENEGVLNTHSEEGLSVESVEVFERTNYDFNVIVSSSAVSLAINITCNFNRYDQLSLKNLMRHLDKVVNAFAHNTDQPLSTLDYLSQEEKHTLLVSYNDTAVAYPKDKTVVDLFEEQAAKTPKKVALVFEGREISYQELNERSNQLAHYLKDTYKIKPDDLVSFQLSRSENIIIVILAILKAGAAYIPIDIDSPEEKIKYVIKDSKCLLIIDENTLNIFIAKSLTYPKINLPKELSPCNLIYAIYTSGSTGLPKGVLIEHRSIVAHIFNVKNLYGVRAESRFLQFFNIAFDAAAQEIFTALSFGATLYIKTPKVDPEYIFDLISSYKITHADFSTAFFNSFIATLNPERLSHQLEFCAIGGEKVEKGVLEKQWHHISNFTKEFYNVYGPTETTLTATWFPIMSQGKLSKFDHVIPIGRSYAGRQVLILDVNQKLMPIGVTGEICIGGNGLARGYLNREALTQEKFIASPFKPGERLYKTGDLGRWLPDGNIEFLGRKDDQVKIRGHRIELGEVEHALLKYEKIKQAVVIVKENQSGEKELVAYVTAKVEQNTNELRAYLKQTLPAYMLPAYFVQLETMPLTANGKVDKKALPDPEGLGLSSGVEYVTPATAQEKALASVWSDVLKREGIGIKDSFYNLGGDSIKSIQVVARLKQRGYSLKVEHILKYPVLEDLCRLMELTTQVSDQSEVSGEVLLTPIQDWFFKAEEIKVPEHFNQSVVLYSKEQLDGEILEKSLADLTRHHDALRMVYQQSPSGAWQQFNQDTSAKRYTLDFYDLRQSEDVLGQMARLGEAQQASIRLSAGPLLRVLHFRLQDGDRLGLIIHHLVVDGVSWRILLEDLSNLYASYKEGKKPSLPSKTDSFQRWAFLQQEYAASPALDKERTYWQKVSEQPMAALPQDKPLPEGRPAVLDSAESFGLDQNTTELLQTRVHRVYNTEINDVLLTGLGLALKEVLTVDKSVLKMEGHGREEILDGVDISRTVGWFTTVYPFVLQVADAANQTQSLVGVKESLRSIPNKGIGYGILSHLSRQGLDSKLTPEITFNYLGDFGSNLSNEGGSLFEYASERIGSNISRDNTTDAILDVSGMLVRGELGMSIRYSSARYEAATIRKIAASYKKNLEVLIEALAKADTTYLTPSDLSFKGLSLQELSQLNADNDLEDVYELSPLQEGIYYHWLAENSNSLYFEQTSYKVRTKGLAIEKLKGAYDRLTARHAVLRTSFTTEYAGRSLQIVRKEVASNFTYQKLDRQADQQAQVAQIKQQDRERGFDLSSGSQMRLHVVELSEGEYEFIWSHHHVLMDGWCTGVLINDFNELLSAALKGTTPDLSPVVPYADYINWLRTIDRESSLSYWKNYLSGYASVAEIPFKAQTADTTYVESVEHLQIGGDLFKKVDALCTEIGITQNTFVQAVWGYLLSRYNNTSDVVFGAVVSGRPADLPGVEDMIGLFINTVPVRVKYTPDDTPVELLKALQEQSIRSASHHYMNLSEVQAQSELGMELMNHIMVFENYAVKELENEGVLNTQREEGLSVESVEVFERTNYNFNLTVHPVPTFININIKYNQNYYSTPLIKRIKNHLSGVVNKFIEHSNQALSI